MSGLKLIVEASASLTNLTHTLEAFNFSTQQWDLVYTGQHAATDVALQFTVSNPSNYKGNGGELRVRLRSRATTPVLSFPWTIRYDQIVWDATMN